MHALLNGGLDCGMKFDMAIISLVLIFYLHNLYRGFSEKILVNLNHFMNIIIRYCKNKGIMLQQKLKTDIQFLFSISSAQFCVF